MNNNLSTPEPEMTDAQLIEKFNAYWDRNYSYVEKIFSNDMVIDYARRTNSIAAAANLIYDWSLANGDAEVQE